MLFVPTAEYVKINNFADRKSRVPLGGATSNETTYCRRSCHPDGGCPRLLVVGNARKSGVGVRCLHNDSLVNPGTGTWCSWLACGAGARWFTVALVGICPGVLSRQAYSLLTGRCAWRGSRYHVHKDVDRTRESAGRLLE